MLWYVRKCGHLVCLHSPRVVRTHLAVGPRRATGSIGAVGPRKANAVGARVIAVSVASVPARVVAGALRHGLQVSDALKVRDNAVINSREDTRSR